MVCTLLFHRVIEPLPSFFFFHSFLCFACKLRPLFFLRIVLVMVSSLCTLKSGFAEARKLFLKCNVYDQCSSKYNLGVIDMLFLKDALFHYVSVVAWHNTVMVIY